MRKKIITLLILSALVLFNFQTVLAAQTVKLDHEEYLIEDYQRFQKIDSPTVAVALSGGGARALVNIGVLKALIEEQIPINLITGTSMGSIIGTMYGSGLSIEQIEEIASQNPFAKLFNLNFTSNKSLLKTAQVNKFIEEIAPYKHLENFPTPTALLSFDLTTGNKYLTTTGKISEVIQSSYSIPYYFPPYKKGNHYLIDPGIVEMSPAKSAKILGADFVIATTAFDKLPYKKYNTPSRSVGRFVNLIQQQNATRILDNYADIVINSNVDNYSFMDFKRAQKLIAIGYQTTKKQMPLIKEKLQKKEIPINYQEQRKKIDLTKQFELLQNDRLVNDNIILNPIFHTGKETNFLTHNILTTYFDQAEYGFQIEKNHLETKLLITNNSEQSLDFQLRWKQLTPKLDWFFKSNIELNNEKYEDFKTELKYYHENTNYSAGIGNIKDDTFFYLGSQYTLGPLRERTHGEINLVLSEENNFRTTFSQETVFNMSDIWRIKPKIAYNDTDLIPSPPIYRGIAPAEDTKLQTGIDFIYNHNFIDPIELNVLQLTNIRFYTFIDYKDTFSDSYAYGIGNKTNFDLLGLKPIDVEAYIAYDNHKQDFKSLIKLDYQF